MNLLAEAPLDRLTDAAELALMRKVALYPRLIETAALSHEPHRIAFYLYELAANFIRPGRTEKACLIYASLYRMMKK